MLKWSILTSFWKYVACGQIVLPDRSISKGQKWVENAKKSKCDILSKFQTMWHWKIEVLSAQCLKITKNVQWRQRRGPIFHNPFDTWQIKNGALSQQPPASLKKNRFAQRECKGKQSSQFFIAVIWVNFFVTLHCIIRRKKCALSDKSQYQELP